MGVINTCGSSQTFCGVRKPSPPKLLILDKTLFAPQTLLFINEMGDQDMVVYPFDYLAY